jgi:hypothetical protein
MRGRRRGREVSKTGLEVNIRMVGTATTGLGGGIDRRQPEAVAKEGL